MSETSIRCATDGATPRCPRCRATMTLFLSVPRYGSAPALEAYRCDPCGEAAVMAGGKPDTR